MFRALKNLLLFLVVVFVGIAAGCVLEVEDAIEQAFHKQHRINRTARRN